MTPKAAVAQTPRLQVDAAIDRCVWYAGWTDKIAQVVGSANPVAGPFFDFSLPEPTGVIAVIAPAASSLLGLVSVVMPAIAGGNTVVVVASENRPLPAVTLTEVFATSDLPGGVVNLLTGRVGRSRAVARVARRRERPRPDRRPARVVARPRSRCGRQSQAGQAARRPTSPTGAPTQASAGSPHFSRRRRYGIRSASEPIERMTARVNWTS